jgi:acetoin utilization protein AcuB
MSAVGPTIHLIFGTPLAFDPGMSKAAAAPTIRSYMTPSPYTIAPGSTMAKAHELMREHRIRHLPVIGGGRLLGVVSQRDLAVMESLQDVDAREVPVEDAMTVEVYTASPDAPLRQVVAEMADRKLGSAVIMDGAAVVGVFTTMDALRALVQVLGPHR